MTDIREFRVEGQILEVSVKAGTSAQGSWTRYGYRIEGPDGFSHWYSSFKKEHASYAQGEVVNVVYTEKANAQGGAPYRNITAMLAADAIQGDGAHAAYGGDGQRTAPAGPVPVAPPPSQHKMADHPDTRRSIERQVALKLALERACTLGATELWAICNAADQFYAWISASEASSSPAQANPDIDGAPHPADTEEDVLLI